MGQRVPHLSAGDNLIHKAVLFQIFCSLEAIRQFLADGLPDHPGAGKADKGTRFGQGDVAQRGEAGGDTARGGMGKDRDV